MTPIKPKIRIASIKAAIVQGSNNLVVAAYGYESRASTVTQALHEQSKGIHFASVDFQDLREGGGRAMNDAFVRDNRIPVQPLSSEDYDAFQAFVLDKLRELSCEGKPTAVHFDYSCMPRTWYCRLALRLLSELRTQDELVLWYTPGKYQEKAFQPAGIDQFDVFSGQSSLSPKTRTHILGLGFEGVRSQAIVSVLDPEYLICYYADPGVNPAYVHRVVEENRDLLLAAQQHFRVPLPDFATAYTRLRSIVCEFRSVGDVVIIPDGPKPLVLAASLVPFSVDQPGVTCLHVRRRTRKPEAALDVVPADLPYGAVLQLPERRSSG